MKTKLQYEKYKNYLYKEHDRSNSRECLGISKILNEEPFDLQWLFKFENGYGASIVKRFGSFGFEEDLFELAVIKWCGENKWHLNYNTKITSDVIGRLTSNEVLDLLEQIKELNHE